eukprot:924503_1
MAALAKESGPSVDALVFRQKGNSKMLFHRNLKYYAKPCVSAKRQRYKCNIVGCNASIITHNKDPLNYEISGKHNMHLMHREYGSPSQRKMDFLDEVSRKVAETHVAPHEAYRMTARERPQHASILRSFGDARWTAYQARKSSGYTLPQKDGDFASALFDNKLDGNYYSQLLQRKDYDETKTSQEQIDEYIKRSCKFFLGDGGTNARV